MKYLSIKSKLLIVLLSVSLGSVVTVAYLGFRSGHQALTASAFNQLTSVRASKAYQIEFYLADLRSKVRTLRTPSTRSTC